MSDELAQKQWNELVFCVRKSLESLLFVVWKGDVDLSTCEGRTPDNSPPFFETLPSIFVKPLDTKM